MPRTMAQSLGKATVALIAFATSGCIAPLPPISYDAARSIPSVVPHLHEDLRTSTEEVLVLIESEAIPDRKKGWSTYWVNAHFYRASQLRDLGADVPREKVDHGWGWLAVLPAGEEGWPVGGWPETSTHVRMVCIVVPDGRTIRLIFDFTGDDYRSLYGELAGETRDRVVASLRSAQSGKPVKLKGPCDLEAYAEWPDAQRTRVVEFLSAAAVK